MSNERVKIKVRKGSNPQEIKAIEVPKIKLQPHISVPPEKLDRTPAKPRYSLGF